MVGTKLQFLRNGPDNQKRPDIVADFKRVDKKQIEKWTPEQRRQAADWLTKVERALKVFKTDILTA